MKHRAIWVPLLPTAAYLVVLECLYRWYEYGLSAGGGGDWIGGFLIVLLTLPGALLNGRAHTQFWIESLGYGAESASNIHRRFIEWHVPIFTTALIIYIVVAMGILMAIGRDRKSL